MSDRPAGAYSKVVERRLLAAGVAPDDPGLLLVRAWNATALERGAVRVELRRGQFGQTRLARVSEL